jgi:Protein of unknown function (DUF2735).
MASSSMRGGARIYEFPVRGRFANGRAGEEAAVLRALNMPENCAMALDGGRYHAEAVAEDRATRTPGDRLQ